MDQIEHILRTLVGAQGEDLLRVAKKACYLVHTPKGEHYYTSGQPIPGPGFLVSGLFRFYTVDPQGIEHTDCLATEPGQTITPSADMVTAFPVNIQALEDSTILVIPMAVAQKLLAENLESAHIFSTHVQKAANMHLELQNVLAQCDATQRYLWFLDKFPGLIDRISHTYIASFLGITSVSLSRIRARQKDQNAER